VITVTVNNTELSLDDLSSIAPQINRRKENGQRMCVCVRIKTDDLFMTLSTAQCPAGGATRPPTRLEARVFALWEKCGLQKEEFSGGQVVSFLQQVTSFMD
jgi:hypothetical protein